MKALKIASALLTVLLAASAAFGLDVVRYENTVRNLRGDVIGGASISVYTANTTTAVTLYSTVGGTTTKANPTATDVNGRFFFYVVPGTYDVRVSGNGITTYTLEDVDLTGGAFAREATDPQLLYGDGAPVAAAPVGSIYQRGDAVPDSALYIQGPVDWYSLMMPANRSGSEYAQFGDQTPDVSSTDFLIFSNQQPTSVTDFDGGVDGQILSVYISDNYTVLVAGGLSGGLFQSDDLFGQGTYCVYRYTSSSESWFLMWSSDMSNVAADYYLDNWDPYGIDATLPVLSDPQFWPGWDADAPRPLYNLVSGACSASLDSTVVLNLDVVCDEPSVISTMWITGGDTTITNYDSTYTTSPHRTINTNVACADGDVYTVNYKIANAGGHQSPWWRGGTFTVIIDDYEPVVLANLVGTPSIIGLCDTTADLEVHVFADILSTVNYCWTKVGSGDTSTVAENAGSGTFHVIEIATDSLCVNGSMFDVFVSLTNDDNSVTGPRHGPYRYTVSGLDETPPAQGVPTLTGQCSNSLVALQLYVTSAEPCYLSAQWRLGATGTWQSVSGQTPFNVLHNVAISTNLACVNNQVFYVQYRLTDQFQNTSAWFSGGSYTVSVTPPPGDTMWPIINSAGCSVVASVVNGNTVLTITIDADETFSAYARAVSGTNTITFGVPQEAAGGSPVYGDPCIRVINTGVAAVQGQTWVVSATLWDDEPTPNYTSPPYSNYVGTAIVDMTPTFGPEITAINGDITDDAGLIITGTNFGVKSPAAPLIWDDFETGSAHLGAEIQDFDSKWSVASTVDEYGLEYNSAWAHSGTVSAYADASHNFNTLYNTERRNTDTLYMTGWIRTAGWDAADNAGSGMATKFFRMNQGTYGAPGPYNGPLLHNFGYRQFAAGDNAALPTSFGLFRHVATNNTGGYYDPGYPFPYYTDWQFNDVPRRVEYYAKLNTPGVHNGIAMSNHIGLDYDIVTNMYSREAGVTLQLSVALFEFSSANGAANKSYETWGDDFYADVTQARVEVGDSPTFLACSHREIQIPTAWSSSSITVEMNQGTFNDGDDCYLYVIDANGTVSDPFLITWGDTGTPADTTPPAIVGGSFSYSNVSWGAAGVDSSAVICSFSTTEPAKVVGQILVTAINGTAPIGYTYEPSDTTGNWSASYLPAFTDTLFTNESWADTINYVTRFLLEDAAGNMSDWIIAPFGAHDGVPPDEPVVAGNDTVYYTFAWNAEGQLYMNQVWNNTEYETGHVVQDSLYYFIWTPRTTSGNAAQTGATAYSRFGPYATYYEFGGYSSPLTAGLATTDTSLVTFSGAGAARRLSGLGDYITEAKFYFRPSTAAAGSYNFTPAPNFYAAALCTASVFWEAEAVALGNPSTPIAYNYLTNNISYASVGEGTWDRAPSTFNSLAKYGYGDSIQTTFVWAGDPWGPETWYVHDLTDEMQDYYAPSGPGNGHGVIIAQMGHAPGVTGAAYPEMGPWRASSAVVRPLLLVKLVIPRTLRIPATQPIPAPAAGKEPEIFGEGP